MESTYDTGLAQRASKWVSNLQQFIGANLELVFMRIQIKIPPPVGGQAVSLASTLERKDTSEVVAIIPCHHYTMPPLYWITIELLFHFGSLPGRLSDFCCIQNDVQNEIKKMSSIYLFIHPVKNLIDL
jgi:hypothetical protein